jgi:hypothetical protein
VMRYFFDYRAKDQSLLDYRGDEFHNPQGAIEFAQAIAHDLKHSLSADWSGWSVEVRSADGAKFYTLAVVSSELLAA